MKFLIILLVTFINSRVINTDVAIDLTDDEKIRFQNLQEYREYSGISESEMMSMWNQVKTSIPLFNVRINGSIYKKNQG